MKSRVSHTSSLFRAVWFEEKGRFRGEFEAADVFPAEDSMIQVRSRGNASHFVERKSPSSPSSGLFSTLERRSDKQKHSVAMTCFAHDYFFVLLQQFWSHLEQQRKWCILRVRDVNRKGGRRLARGDTVSWYIKYQVLGVLFTDYCNRLGFMCSVCKPFLFAS